MNPVAIVVLGKFPEIFNKFRDNVNELFPDTPKIFVRDGYLIAAPEGDKWTLVQGPPVFTMPGNGNLGWEKVPSDHDMLYVGDDVHFVQQNTIELLQRAAYSDPTVGLLSPKILGHAGNPLQMRPNPTGLTYSEQRGLMFICIYIKREVLDKVGFMDPIYGGNYGYDDDDYNHRARLAGFKLAITPDVEVEHRHPTSTFMKALGPRGGDCSVNAEKFKKKWGFLP
jgi:hypothetical protein